MTRSPRRRAFATFAALMLLGIVGVALELLITTTATEARRTQARADEAQLEALLLAGAEAARNIAGSNKATVEVPMPKELELATLRVTRSATAGDFEIHASYRNRTLSEHIHVIQRGDAWIIDRAELD